MAQIRVMYMNGETGGMSLSIMLQLEMLIVVQLSHEI